MKRAAYASAGGKASGRASEAVNLTNQTRLLIPQVYGNLD